MTERKTIGGIPVECLTGEAAAIWSGWRTLGDREVVREASAKGTHISLAQKCLSCRKNCNIEQAIDYFNQEVDIWVHELLRKHQIYRVSHILNNTGNDPAKYIFNICIKCMEPSLRDYLCEYLKSISYLENEHIEAWEIIKCIVEYEKKIMLIGILSSHICIENILNLSLAIKESLCTELYFHTRNNAILKNVTSNSLWDYLLCNNRIETLISWIDLQHNCKLTLELADENFKRLLSTLPITNDMIEIIDLSEGTFLSKDLIKNHLSRYGIFTKSEKQNVRLTLARIFGNGVTLTKFKSVLLSNFCNIDASELASEIEKEIILSYSLYKLRCTAINADMESKIINLSKTLSSLCELENATPDLLIHGIMESIYYITNDTKYLKENDSLLFSLIFLHFSKLSLTSDNPTESDKEILKNIFKNQIDLKCGQYTIPYEFLQNLLKKNPILYQIIENQIGKSDITVYELLNGFENLDTKKAFKWYYKDNILPHFASTALIKKYGYKETLSYIYYLKEARPNMAIINLKQTQGKLYSTIPPAIKSQAAYNAHIFALDHLDNIEVLCSCISFIEMLGLDPNTLRIHATLAKYLQQDQNLSVGYLFKTIIQNNQENLKIIITYLEQSFAKIFDNGDIFNNLNEFVYALKNWEIIVQFAHAHNVLLIPDQLLKSLARQNCWFEFILVAHIFAYPLNQVLQNIMLFNDTNIRFHLTTCYSKLELLSTRAAEQKTKGRDVKQSPYYGTNVKHCESVTSNIMNSIDTNTNQIQSTTLKLPTLNYNYSKDDDFWLTILKCHQSQDPPGGLVSASRFTLAPIYIVLASCYEPSSIASYCYSWMVISTTREDFLNEYADCLEQQIWSVAKISNLLQKMVLNGYIKVLHRAYKIFMPYNPFSIFFECLMESINYRNFDNSFKLLLEFKAQCATRKCNKIFNWDCSDTIYLENSYWFLSVSIRCIIIALGHNFQSALLQSKFLDMLVKSNIKIDNPVQMPDFQKLLKILNILLKTKVRLDFKNYKLTENEYNFDNEIERCIEMLVKDNDYSSALEISIISGLNSSNVILAKYRNEFRDQLKKTNKIDVTFWSKCAFDFNKYNVCSEKTAEFFVEHAEKVSSYVERYDILRLALETLKNIETDKQIIDTLEVAMWKSCILAGPDNVKLHYSNDNFNKLKTELLSGLCDLQVHCSLNDSSEEKSAEILINKLINLGKIDIALRVCAIFHYKHRDLQILMLCLALAEGEILPTEMTVQQRNLVMESIKGKRQKYSSLRNRGLRRLSSSSSSLNISISNFNITTETDNASDLKQPHQMQIECIDLLEKLMSSLHCGHNICSKVILCYKLSVELGKSYQTLLTLSEPIQFLQDIVGSKIDNKIEIAKDIITVYSIKNEEVTNFLAQNITSNIVSALEGGHDDAIFIWGYSLNTKFHLLIDLCSDPSLLGLQLFEVIQKQFSHPQYEKTALKISIELLIRSHDCFTTACNMEGIASVLRKCQQLANILQNLKLWTLLVRLVTGVGRFTEMNYVFQILKENDQFEFLLVKGLDKVSGLKTALLEFLKRNCSENKELFILVASHFSLYYEIALMWENKANEAINGLVSQARKEIAKLSNVYQLDVKLTRKENIEKILHSVVTYFTYAAQHYLQDNKLNLATRCSDQGKLVSLQIALLSNVSQNQQAICILNLKIDEIDKILCQILTYSQTLIIIRAYNYQVDWANVIYSHCILKGESKYLKDFIEFNGLTSSLVEDCARRYRSEKSITHKMTENMQIIIAELSDVECKYKLASQLGFKHTIETMLNNPIIGAYLKDTIWKKGTLQT